MHNCMPLYLIKHWEKVFIPLKCVKTKCMPYIEYNNDNNNNNNNKKNNNAVSGVGDY